MLAKVFAAQRLPLFSKGDIDSFIIRFERFCKDFDIKEEERVEEVVCFLSGDALEWHCNYGDFASWKFWQVVAREKFGMSEDIIYSKLMSLKLKETDSMNDFLDRFNYLLGKYQTVICGTVFYTERSKVIEMFKKNQAMKIFYHILPDKQRIILSQNGPDNVDDAVKLIRKVSKYQTEMEGSSLNMYPEPNKVIENNMDKLLDRFEKMAILLVNGQTPTNRNNRCFNCQKECNHTARNCPEPCGICRDKNHTSTYCPDRVKRTTNRDNNQRENFLVEILGAERDNSIKHKLKHILNPYEIPERYRFNYQNKDNHIPTSQQQDSNQDFIETKIKEDNYEEDLNKPMEVDEILTAPKVEIQETQKPKVIINRPNLDFQPISAESILCNTNVNVSLAALCKSSPAFRNSLHQVISQTRLRFKDNDETYLINAEPKSSKPSGAPRVIGKVEGNPTSIILDGGSGTNIVTSNLLSRIGVDEIFESEEQYTFANGESAMCIGEVHDLSIEVGGVLIVISAAVFNHTKYEILLGQNALQQLGIIANFKDQQWLIDNNSEIIPLDIMYKNISTDISEPEVYTVESITNQLDELPHLNEQQRMNITVLMNNFVDQLAIEEEDLKLAKGFKHTILTNSEIPIANKPYRLPKVHEQFVETEIEKMIKQKLIRPSSSPWASPVVVVPKKGGKLRMCVNYIPLNRITVNENYPLPLISDIMASFSGAQWFSNLDLFSGYHQLGMDEESIQKTAFVTKFGQFEYLRMPFGLSGAPRTFQKMMNSIFKDLLFKKVTIYLDDITIFSKTFEQHLIDVKECLERIKEFNLSLNASKSLLFRKELDLLGHVVTSDGKKPNPHKVLAIKSWPVPTNTQQVLSFIGTIGYFQQFIQNYSQIASPLFDLVKKKTTFQWSEKHLKAFNSLKEYISSEPILIHPDFSKPFVIFTDASDLAIGAMLAQEVDGIHLPIEFMSKKFSPAEKNYCIYDKEILAVIRALRKFRFYVLGHRLTIVTDNLAVKFIMNNNQVNGRRIRWIMEMAEYNFNIHHIKGKDNCVADGLSRQESMMIEESKLDLEEDLKEIFAWLRYGTYQLDQLESIIKRSLKFTVLGNQLFKKDNFQLLVVPEVKQRRTIIREAHDGAGHYGINTVMERLKTRYWWPDFRSMAEEYIKSCYPCQLFSKNHNVRKPINPIVVSGMFELWGMDFIGPLPVSGQGNRYILVATEYFTRWPVAKACKTADAQTVAKFLYEDIFSVYGPPHKFVSDQGSHFRNEIIKEFMNCIKTLHHFSTAYNPQCNGLTERFNQTIIKDLERSAYQDHSNWDKHLPKALWNYRSKIHSTTKQTPYKLLYGIEVQDPRFIKEVNQNQRDLEMDRSRSLNYFQLRESATQMENRINQHKDTIVTFEIGQQVLMFKNSLTNSFSKKFIPKWTGPYKIASKEPFHNYKLSDLKGKLLDQTINGNRLKLYHTLE